VASAQEKESDILKFSGSLYGESTDNRDSTPTPESNFDLYVKPRMDVHLVSEHGSTLDFHYAPYYRYRSNPSSIENQTELFHDLGLSVQNQPNPVTTLQLNEYFYRTEDPSVDANGVELRSDCSYIMNHIDASANYELSDRITSVNLAGRSTVKRYDDTTVAQESDEDNSGVTLTGWHQIQRTLALMGVLDVAEYGYDSSLGIDRDFNAISAGAGVEKNVNKNLKVNLRAGLIAATYKDKSLSSESQPFVSLNLNGQSTPAARIDATLSYMIRDADVYPFSSQECAQFYTKMAWDCTELLTLELYGTYRNGQYKSDSLDAAGLAYQEATGFKTSGSEKTLLFGGDISYKMGLTTSVMLAQSYEHVDSDVCAGFTRNATSLLITEQF
jgi:hypothetical protein